MISSLHVITDRDRRGAQVHAMDLATGLASRGGDTEVVALAPGEHGDLLPVEALGPTRRSTATLRALRRRGAAADVVVAHGSATLAACAMAFAGTRTRFVYRQISDPLFWAGTTNRRVRVAAAIHRARRVVTLSDEMARTFARRYWLRDDRFITIPNAVPAAPWYPPDDDQRSAARAAFGVPGDAVVVAYLGALVPEKGVDAAIRAVADLPGVQLLVAGDGTERAELERLAGSLDAAVRFIGPTDEPRRVLHAADVLVLASRGGDSMPAVLIEAGLCAVPAVSTPIGAIVDVIDDGVTGRIVPVGDQPALTDALRTLAQDPRLRSAAGDAARERCSTLYTIDAVAPAWESVLESVAGTTAVGR